jgi:hypothetical protein
MPVSLKPETKITSVDELDHALAALDKAISRIPR